MGLALFTSTPVLTHSCDCKALNSGRRAANVAPQSENSCLGGGWGGAVERQTDAVRVFHNRACVWVDGSQRRSQPSAL